MKTIFQFFFPYQWFSVFLFGMLLILSGLLIVLVPQILVALIALILISAGLFFVGLAWNLRSIEKRDQHIEIFIE